jgi:hypothetical protein
MPVAAPRDTFEGTPSRLELEVRLGVVLAELSEERERSRVAEKKCEELISEASRQVVALCLCMDCSFHRFASSCAGIFTSRFLAWGRNAMYEERNVNTV